jgi:hypothetical protein
VLHKIANKNKNAFRVVCLAADIQRISDADDCQKNIMVVPAFIAPAGKHRMRYYFMDGNCQDAQ